MASAGETEAATLEPLTWLDHLDAQGKLVRVTRWTFAVRPVLTDAEAASERACYDALIAARHADFVARYGEQGAADLARKYGLP